MISRARGGGASAAGAGASAGAKRVVSPVSPRRDLAGLPGGAGLAPMQPQRSSGVGARHVAAAAAAPTTDAGQPPPPLSSLLDSDPALRPFEEHLSYRWQRYLEAKAEIAAAVDGVKASGESAAGGGGSTSNGDNDNDNDNNSSPLAAFAASYRTWGLQRAPGRVTLREWIPGASAVALIGDFNGWAPRDGLDWARRDAYGVWTLALPDSLDSASAAPSGDGNGKNSGENSGGNGGKNGGKAEGGTPAIAHGSRYKLRVQSASGGWWADRVSAWARYATAPQGEMGATFDGVAWWPPDEQKYRWRHPRPPPIGSAGGGYGRDTGLPALRIYEAHVGMSGEREGVATYAAFAEEVLPRLVKGGYNAVQLMAVQEHAYYASFGYHVTSPFAVSSRSGTPEDLKRLVDAAHALGLRVLLDVVHSHASRNEADGIAGFDLSGGRGDGSGGGSSNDNAGALVRTGKAGYHSGWDSRVYSYERLETRRYLLSNLRYWVDELGFDGFRFDGVTSMLYQHHGIGVGFSGQYGEYFGTGTDVEACVYLMLANEAVKGGLVGAGAGGEGAVAGGGSSEGAGKKGKSAGRNESASGGSGGGLSSSPFDPPPAPDVLTIAEDVSGMPGLCAPVSAGGLGFDARLAMAAPDLWIRLLKHVPDEGWRMSEIVATLCGRRYGEGRVGTVAYSESHDQAMVGDKTVAMWLFGAEIYEGMSALSPASPVVERGVALHKCISAATVALGGEARMTFMGNEFGHPEWIDFPSSANGWSHKFARRQWSLADRQDLRYAQLGGWDAALNAADDAHGFVASGRQWATLVDDGAQLIVAERGPLLWVLNFSPSLDHGGKLRVPAPEPGKWRVVLDSDAACFGGRGRVPWRDYFTTPAGGEGGDDGAGGAQFHGRGQWLEVASPPRTAVAYVRVREEEVGADSGDGASEALTPPFEQGREERAEDEEEGAGRRKEEEPAAGPNEVRAAAASAPSPRAGAAEPVAAAAAAAPADKGGKEEEGGGVERRGDSLVFRF